MNSRFVFDREEEKNACFAFSTFCYSVFSYKDEMRRAEKEGSDSIYDGIMFDVPFTKKIHVFPFQLSAIQCLSIKME